MGIKFYKAMNAKLIIILAAAAGAVSIAATGAYYSNHKTADANAFSAGTLDLSLEDPAPAGTDALAGQPWTPGTEFESSIDLRNDGTLPIGSITMQAATEIAE